MKLRFPINHFQKKGTTQTISGISKKSGTPAIYMEMNQNSHNQGEGFTKTISILLELSAVDDLASFKHAIEEEGEDTDESSLWYGRRIGSNKMGFEERTPLMVAAMFGSKHVLAYILHSGAADPNRACGSDGATALHCVAASGSNLSCEIVRLLIEATADINCLDANGNRPRDVISPGWARKNVNLRTMLGGEAPSDDVDDAARGGSKQHPERKEYPVDPSLPDMNDGIYGTDEFRMYVFKVRPCSRAYSHDWTECPLVHPGENARRRDPSKYHYSCVPCPDFRRATCAKADACEFAHGIFESWLHPAQYRTRMCKDEPLCTRKICFFAHGPDELRSTFASAVASPRSMSSVGSPSLSPSTWAMWQSQSSFVAPPALQLTGELRDLENQRRRRQLLEELASLTPQTHYPYSSSLPSSPLRSSYGTSQGPNLRAIALSPPTRSSAIMPSRLSDWGLEPDGRSGFGMVGEELRKSMVSPDVSWVHSIIKDTPALNSDEPSFEEDLAQRKQSSCLNHGDSEVIPSWLEQQWMIA